MNLSAFYLFFAGCARRPIPSRLLCSSRSHRQFGSTLTPFFFSFTDVEMGRLQKGGTCNT